MTTSPTAWARPHHQASEQTASVVLLAFARGALDLSRPLDPARHGLPASFPFDALDLRSHLRAQNPDWFAGFETPEMRHAGALDVGDLIRVFPRCEAAYSIQIDLEEPSDLGYLQGCWAAAQWLCDAGADLVHDAQAMRWHDARAISAQDPQRPFDIHREVSVVFETVATGDFGHVTHTRGLAKFARPDVLLLGAQPADAPACAVLLNALATRAALGAPLEPGQPVAPSGLERRTLLEYEPGSVHPDVNLNNDGVVLDIRGWGLGETVSGPAGRDLLGARLVPEA